MQNAVPRLRIAITDKIQEVLGTATNPQTEETGGGLDYLIAQDYMGKLAQFKTSRRPVVVIHMRQVTAIPDEPLRDEGLPAYANWDIHITQGLIDNTSAGYSHHTANRLWDIADFIAGRLHREHLVPGVEIGVSEVISITPDQRETQERVDSYGILINGRTRVLISSQRSLDSDQQFRTFFGTVDLGTIDSTTVDVNFS